MWELSSSPSYLHACVNSCGTRWQYLLFKQMLSSFYFVPGLIALNPGLQKTRIVSGFFQMNQSFMMGWACNQVEAPNSPY